MSFKDLALPLIARGLYVHPISADGRKVPLLKDWPNQASNMKRQILVWDAAFERDINCGVVGRGVVILDDDRGDLAEVIEKETGQALPLTYRVQTGVKKATGVRGMHWYLKESVRSIMCGSRKKAGVYDFQADMGHQVAGAGSRHHSGVIYEEADPAAKILDCPDWLVDWIESTADAAKERSDRKSDREPVVEEFDFGDWCNHYSPIFRIADHGGNYYYPDPCPWTDHRHEHAPKTGFYWDGANLGWSDFVTSCEGSEKSIRHTIKMLNARMLELGHEPYPYLIWPDDLDYLLDVFKAEEAVLPPECRYKFTYEGKAGRIFSNDGIHWFDAEDQPIK